MCCVVVVDALEVVGVKTLTKQQVDMVYNQFHFSSEDGITEEEMLLALGKVFVQASCTDAKMAFRLACVMFLQNAGMIQGYSVCVLPKCHVQRAFSL